MQELVRLWQHTRLVVLTAILGALYAAILIPFKMFPIVPGVTEIRPGNAIPVLASLLFGPAAAWGAAFGNTIGDFFGTLGPGTLFGFLGNLLFGYLPYRVWNVRGRTGVMPEANLSWWSDFLLATYLASVACAVTVAYGIEWLGLAPFEAVSSLILVNNFLMAALLAPPLLRHFAPRVEKIGWLYRDLLPKEDRREARMPRFGLLLLFVALTTTFGLGLIARAWWGDDAVIWATTPPFVVALYAIYLV